MKESEMATGREKKKTQRDKEGIRGKQEEKKRRATKDGIQEV